jgi:protein SCO1/2
MTARGMSEFASNSKAWLLVVVASVAPILLLVAAMQYPPSAAWLRSVDRPKYFGKEVAAQDSRVSFSLTDSSGRRRSLTDFRGKVVLLTFGYTHCPDACPTTLARLAQVRQLLGADAANVQVLFVTIDPERDSAQLLGDYVHTFDPTFVALRGTESETDSAAGSFHAEYRLFERGKEVLVEHTVDTYLLDPKGRVRVILPYDLSAADAERDVHSILREAGLCSPWSRSQSERPTFFTEAAPNAIVKVV